MMQKTRKVSSRALMFALTLSSMLLSLLLSTFVVAGNSLLKAKPATTSCAVLKGKVCNVNGVCLDNYGEDSGCACDANNICMC